MFRTIDVAPRPRPRTSAAFIEPLERRTFLSGVITGIVFDDLNANGGRDPGDQPLAGQTVEISRQAYPPISDVRTADTGPDGRYVFADVPDGTYAVRWLPAGDRYQTGHWDRTRYYSVPPGPGYPEGWLNFGNAVLGSISGSVYVDLDRDGVRDRGEPPAAGQTVFIDYDNDGVDRGSDASRAICWSFSPMVTSKS